jgi:Acetyltransferase (GNAT) domain
VQRFLGGPVDRARSWRSLAAHIGHWQLRGYGNWALERRGDGRTIGRAGLWNPEGWFGVEVGWRLDRDAWAGGTRPRRPRRRSSGRGAAWTSTASSR